jgi:hypothetical protein
MAELLDSNSESEHEESSLNSNGCFMCQPEVYRQFDEENQNEDSLSFQQ